MSKIDYNREGDDKGGSKIVCCLKCPPQCLDRFARQRFSRRKFAKQQSHPQPTTSCRRNNQKAFLCFETLQISLIHFSSEQIINPRILHNIDPLLSKSLCMQWGSHENEDVMMMMMIVRKRMTMMMVVVSQSPNMRLDGQD